MAGAVGGKADSGASQGGVGPDSCTVGSAYPCGPEAHTWRAGAPQVLELGRYRCEIKKKTNISSPRGANTPLDPQLLVYMSYDVMMGQCSCRVLPTRYDQSILWPFPVSA